jgi:hypothetical protein
LLALIELGAGEAQLLGDVVVGLPRRRTDRGLRLLRLVELVLRVSEIGAHGEGPDEKADREHPEPDGGPVLYVVPLL